MDCSSSCQTAGLRVFVLEMFSTPRSWLIIRDTENVNLKDGSTDILINEVRMSNSSSSSLFSKSV